jgi:conjugal transfer pilus assembly protein TraF
MNSMKKHLSLYLLCCVLSLGGEPCMAANVYFNESPQGWHWNNLKTPVKKTRIKRSKQTATPSSHDPLTVLHHVKQALQRAKARAVLVPTVQNVSRYLRMQQWVVNQSTRFTQVWKETLLKHPSLDYGITHPTESQARQGYLAVKRHVKQRLVARLAKTHGLFFFYRGNNLLDREFAKTVIAFASAHGFSMIGVPMDHHALPFVPNNHINTNQAQALGVSALPAVFLVAPRLHQVMPVAYGYHSQNELLTAMFNAATHFRQEGS